MKNLSISKIKTSSFHQGFLGEGHQAAAIIDGQHFLETDPFILLMDDQLDLPGHEPAGGAHPHAGFETVTLVLEGNDKEWKTGSLELMTAGKGIIHTEEIKTKTQMRILQLWLALPPDKRWAEPRLQQLLLEHVPTLKTDKSEIRVYSGSSQGLTSPLQNYTPFTLVDFNLKDDATAVQQLAFVTAFIYVLNGSLWVGDTKVVAGQSAWMEKSVSDDSGEITFNTKEEGARFILYAGTPHHAPIVSHGPFIGNTQDDIKRLYTEYHRGKMLHLNDLPESSKIYYNTLHANV